MFRLAHISDPHLGPLPPVGLRDLMSKRLFGYVNWRRNRDRAQDASVLQALVDDMRAQAPDHVAVTGDLVNLGLPAEFDAAGAWLADLGAHHAVTVVPGNHDAYVASAAARYAETWHPHMRADDNDSADVSFPFIRRRGPIALVGVSTAVATAPLLATGRIGRAQSAALGEILSELGNEGLFRIVLIHHPPTVGGNPHWHRRLVDADLVRAPVSRAGAELIIHGHNHKTSVGAIAGPEGAVPVVGAPAASRLPNEHRAGGAYLLFDVDPGPGTVTMTERGIRVPGGPVETLSERNLDG
jgi:3',5'-cyclic AMP phosphodiesterase CpdA